MVQDGLYYTKEHEWAKIQGDEAVFGITDHAQSELGDITFIELPRKGAVLKQSAGYATVESVKAASDVYAPLSGKVVDVNSSLESSPEAVNRSPYENGWICRVKVTDPGEKNNLMGPAEYKKYLEGLDK
jgi:glycine cleavage system H protein